jgi:hypothetical protein
MPPIRTFMPARSAALRTYLAPPPCHLAAGASHRQGHEVAFGQEIVDQFASAPVPQPRRMLPGVHPEGSAGTEKVGRLPGAGVGKPVCAQSAFPSATASKASIVGPIAPEGCTVIAKFPSVISDMAAAQVLAPPWMTSRDGWNADAMVQRISARDSRARGPKAMRRLRRAPRASRILASNLFL